MHISRPASRPGPSRHRGKLPRRSALASALAGATLCLGLGALPAAAQAQSAEVRSARMLEFAIAAGPLDAALDRFARSAGINLSYDAALVAGLSSRGLQGGYTIADGLTTLLAGTGLEAVARTGGYSLRRAPAAPNAARPATTLAEVRVKARRAGDGTTEDSGSYTSRVTSIASKTDMAFREIPQSLSVITHEQINDQKLVDINDALKLMPGITANRMNDNTYNFYSRGFQITSMQVDGGAPLALGAYTYGPLQDMAFYDRVEVMRGASGLLGGMGDPGGIINLARKKPLAEPQAIVELSAGSWDNYRAMADLSGPLNEAASLRGRAVVLYENRDYHLDHRNTEKPAFYGVLEADLGERTLLTLGGSYTRRNETGGGSGLPLYADGSSPRYKRSDSLTQSWTYKDSDETELFAQLAHTFSSGWALKFNLTHSETETEADTAFVGGPVDPVTHQGVWAGGHYEYENRQDLADINLSGTFDLFGRSHELLVGADWQRVKSRWVSATFPGHWSDPADVLDGGGGWNPDRDVSQRGHTRFGPWGQEQVGGYAVLRLHPTDRLHLVAGARASRYEFDQRISSKPNAAAPWVVSSDLPFSLKTKITPYGGVIYDFADNWSAYLSYASIYKPQSLMLYGPPPGSRSLDPIEGKSYEAGVKGELYGGRLNATLSVFSVERTGTALQDSRYPSNYDAWAGNCCYLPQGKVTSRGVDVEIGGELMPGWQAAVGYTFNISRDEKASTNYSSITPRHLLKLSTAYTLPGELWRWKVGGSAHIQSDTSVSDTITLNGNTQPYDFKQGGYAIVNALVQYRLDPKWTLALNLNNLFDRVYYERIGTVSDGNWYGTPFNAMLTLRYQH